MPAENRVAPEKESEYEFQARMLNTLRDAGFDVPDRAVVVEGRWNRCQDIVGGDTGIKKSGAFIFGKNDRTGSPYCLYKSFKRDIVADHYTRAGEPIEFARGWFERTRSPAPLAPAANQSIHTPAPAPVAPYIQPSPLTLAARLALQPAQRAEMEKAATVISELLKLGTKIELGERSYLKNPDLNPAGLKQTDDHKIIVPIYRPTPDLSGVELAGGQLISGSGFKHFTPGSKPGGGFALIPSTSTNPEKWLARLAVTDKPLILCEGVGTALAIYQSTGYPVIAALSAKNLPVVAEWLKESGRAAGKAIVVFGDNDLDHAEPSVAFVGIRQATSAAEMLGCRVVVANSEQRGYDARDLMRDHGPQAVLDYMDGTVTPEMMRSSERPEAFAERVERLPDEPEPELGR